MRKYIIITGIIAFFTWSLTGPVNVSAEEWTVPQDQRERTAPALFTAEQIKSGADLYQKNCHSCHGDPTKGNFARLDPSPGDPASGKFQALTDGEMFYKITTGKGAMPQFGMILSEEQRWSLVAYVRSFHPGYIQPEPEVGTRGGGGVRAGLTVTVDTLSRMVSVLVSIPDGSSTKPLPGAEVRFFVKRYFGQQPIASGIRSNSLGKIDFLFPSGIPGDSAGRVNLGVRLDEAGGYGSASREITVPFGDPTQWVSLTDPRAMWNVRAKAPVWLILTYSLTVIGVMITILYILLQFRKIHRLGSDTADPANSSTKTH